MKDGRTHLAYKAENTIDLDTDIVVGAEVFHADRGDADTLTESVVHAQQNLIDSESDGEIKEVVADKGYHSAKSLQELELRGYIPEREQKGKRRWTDKPDGQKEAVYLNRRRVRGNRSKALQRKRSEMVERSFAHVCETGGGRRTWLRGLVRDDETLPDSGRCEKPRGDPANAVRNRDGKEPSGLSCDC